MVQLGVQEARSLATLFTTATLRSLAAPTPWDAIRRLEPFPDIVDADIPLGEVLDELFNSLARTRASEYVYKNAIVSRLVFGRHRPTTAGATTEMPIGRSFADVVVVNGTITVYEIKTDLDSFARLNDQLADYSTVAEHVYVATSQRRAEAALRMAPLHVGVLTVDKRGRISTQRESAGGTGRIYASSLFGSLRQAERVEVLRELAVSAVGSSTGALREAFTTIPIEDLYPSVVRILRTRLMSPARLVGEDKFPLSLRALAYGADLNPSARARLVSRLRGLPRELFEIP
ncbi:sce7726 family protein [Microbacterium aurum]|uniref:sce7726 family protein n=1 Tax=Microbacterium aurum TaxID=36805 RepID=UPI0012F4B221|nr:sce7726 family protein [Microbacterium aurum]MBM7826314.1 hypothetical protein [Microbacterium aurum]